VADDKEREDGQQERPSRPVTAASRRESRAANRPASRKDAGDTPKAKAKEARPAKAAPDAKGRATPTRDGRDNRPSPIARIFRFLREVVAELRKVIWPTRKQMITYTAVVLVFLAVMVAVIAGLDVGIGKGVFAIFG
jgi:preprotein translocase subunit SecE